MVEVEAIPKEQIDVLPKDKTTILIPLDSALAKPGMVFKFPGICQDPNEYDKRHTFCYVPQDPFKNCFDFDDDKYVYIDPRTLVEVYNF